MALAGYDTFYPSGPIKDMPDFSNLRVNLGTGGVSGGPGISPVQSRPLEDRQAPGGSLFNESEWQVNPRGYYENIYTGELTTRAGLDNIKKYADMLASGTSWRSLPDDGTLNWEDSGLGGEYANVDLDSLPPAIQRDVLETLVTTPRTSRGGWYGLSKSQKLGLLLGIGGGTIAGLAAGGGGAAAGAGGGASSGAGSAASVLQPVTAGGSYLPNLVGPGTAAAAGGALQPVSVTASRLPNIAGAAGAAGSALQPINASDYIPPGSGQSGGGLANSLLDRLPDIAGVAGPLVGGYLDYRAAGDATDARLEAANRGLDLAERQYQDTLADTRAVGDRINSETGALRDDLLGRYDSAQADLTGRSDALGGQIRSDLGGYRTRTGSALDDFQDRTRADISAFESNSGGYTQPYRDLGVQAVQNLSDPRSSFEASPDYEFRRGEGTRGIENTFAARGGGASGNALRALADFNSGLASGEYANWYGRQANNAGLGQNAVGQQLAAEQFGTGLGVDADRYATGARTDADRFATGLGVDAGLSLNDLNARNTLALLSGRANTGLDLQRQRTQAGLGLADIRSGAGSRYAGNAINLLQGAGEAGALGAYGQYGAINRGAGGALDNFLYNWGRRNG